MNEEGTLNLNNKCEYTRCVLPDLGAKPPTKEELEEEKNLDDEIEARKYERLMKKREERKKREHECDDDNGVERNKRPKKKLKIEKYKNNNENSIEDYCTFGLELLFEDDTNKHCQNHERLRLGLQRTISVRGKALTLEQIRKNRRRVQEKQMKMREKEDKIISAMRKQPIVGKIP